MRNFIAYWYYGLDDLLAGVLGVIIIHFLFGYLLYI